MTKRDSVHEGESLKRKKYEKELRRLHAELCKLRDWVKYKGLRIIVVFEGRDAVGKGGTIRAVTERVCRSGAPERTQIDPGEILSCQRYLGPRPPEMCQGN